MTSTRPIILFLSGFGDGAGLFEPMHDTDLAQDYDLRPLSMHGFGAPRQAGETTLQTLADWVAKEAGSTGAEIVVAHSVASLVAALAAMTADSRTAQSCRSKSISLPRMPTSRAPRPTIRTPMPFAVRFWAV